MATNDLKNELLKKVVNIDLRKEEKEKEKDSELLDSELNEISGGISERENADSCKCGVALAMA